MTKREMQTIVTATLKALEGAGIAKPAVKADKPAVSRVEAYEAAVIKGLNAKGIKSADIQLRVNVLPYKGWIAQGRVVMKGQHGVRGLFHITQTEELKEKVAA